MKEKYAFIIPAGGLGSRLYPLTKEYPKPCLPIYFDENNEIIRLIDLPIMFCQEKSIPIYIALDYKKEKLKYLENKSNIKVFYTNCECLSEVIYICLNELKKDNIKYYSVFASDYLIPINIILNMLHSIDSKTETIALCSKDSNYSPIKIKSDNGRFSHTEGVDVYDLTFHVGSVDKGINCFRELMNNNIYDFWEHLYPKVNKEDWQKAKILITDISHIDAGTPKSYYEVLYKLNYENIDNNGNIVFPGAKINSNSKNIVALPNSDSSNIVLENCIVGEDVCVKSYDDVLIIDSNTKEYFNKIKIKDFIWEKK